MRDIAAVNRPIRFEVIEIADTRATLVAIDGTPLFRATHIGKELREGVGGRKDEARRQNGA